MATTTDDLARLDALTIAPERRAGRWRRMQSKALPPILAIVVVLAVWQLVVVLEVKEDYELPPPLDVYRSLADQWSQGTVQEAVWNSIRRGAVGFVLSVGIGTLVGVVVATARPIRTAIGPTLNGLQILPSVAWVPAAIIWFGLSEATYYTVVLLGAVPSIASGFVAGVDQIPPLYHRVGRVLGAGRVAAIRHVLLPAALPSYLAGLKQGWAFAWRSLMAAELIVQSAGGLGGYLDIGRSLSDMSHVMGGILAIFAVGIAVELLAFAPIERRVLRNRGLLVEAGRTVGI